jgi:hypothetical protein
MRNIIAEIKTEEFRRVRIGIGKPPENVPLVDYVLSDVPKAEREIMYKAFEIAGHPASTVDEKFGGMINAFKLGAPPHGGIAPGVDRTVMMLADEPNIREVIAFPFNQQAQDLMMNAPAEVTLKQLRELHLQVVLPKKMAEQNADKSAE